MKSFISLVIILCSIADGLFAQFSIGTAQLTYVDASRNNRSIPAQVYYPANTAGQNATPASGSFPLVVVGHGFAMGIDAYLHFKDVLVPQGYIVALCNTETSLSPSHQDFGYDLLFLTNSMNGSSQNEPSFILYQHMNGKAAVVGHSMGGGAGVLASSFASPGEITCYIGLAPAETNLSAIAAAASVAIPSLIFSGQGDNVTPQANHQIPIYNNLNQSCASLVTVLGGGHCYFALANAACDFGETFSNSNISITRAAQQDVMFDIMIPFLEYELKSSTSSLAAFKDSLLTSPRISVQQKNCESLSISDEKESVFHIQVKNNLQVNQVLNISAFASQPSNVLFEIYDMKGVRYYSSQHFISPSANDLSIPVSSLSSGMYMLHYTSAPGKSDTIKFHVVGN
jgi:pimeloyl-ACP methyl ester carboxylesterase